MPDADSYLKRFIDDVQKIDDYVLKDRGNYSYIDSYNNNNNNNNNNNFINNN